MRHTRRAAITTWRAAIPLAALVSAAACGDGPVPPIVPEELSIAAGDLQCGLAGAPLPRLLEVLVIGSDGAPLAGEGIVWSPFGASGTVEPQITVTDRLGRARTLWTLGADPSTQAVTAIPAELTPVRFDAMALDPGVVELSYTLGSLVTGTLEAADCAEFDGLWTDYYAFSAGQPVSLEVTHASAAFDPSLFLLDASRRPIATGAAAAGSAALRTLLPTGEYAIAAGSSRAATGGDYEMTATTIAENVTDCGTVWVRRGTQTAQAIEITDCLVFTDEGGNIYGDRFQIPLFSGDAITVTQSSSDVDALLTLYNSAGIVVGRDDNGGGGVNARLQFTAGAHDVYTLEAATARSDEQGAYLLSIQ